MKYDDMVKNTFLSVLTLMLLAACGPQIPVSFTEVDRLPRIYPDYVDVTIPVNIAPLTFELDEEADEMIARYAATDGSAMEIICADKMQPNLDDWHTLVHSTIQVDVYARHGDQWTHYKPFHIYVSPDSIDPYLSYRLIPPSYVSYEALTISQRCLENYDESVIYDNMLCGFEKEGQCINCHSYQSYHPERFQFHARQKNGGTVIAYDGTIKKVVETEHGPKQLKNFNPMQKCRFVTMNKSGKILTAAEANLQQLPALKSTMGPNKETVLAGMQNNSWTRVSGVDFSKKPTGGTLKYSAKDYLFSK